MRKFQLSLLVASLVLAATCGCQQPIASPSEWKTHQVDTMSIKFPVDPKRTQKTEDTAIGKIEFAILQAEIRGRWAFFASSNDYPKLNQTFNVKDGLDGAINGASKNTKSTISKSKDLTKNGVMGREVLLRSPEGLFIRARYYLNGEGPTLYQANVVSNKEERVYDETASAFLDSMEFPPAESASTPEQ